MAADPTGLFFERLNQLDRKASEEDIAHCIAILGDHTRLNCEQFLANVARGGEIPTQSWKA